MEQIFAILRGKGGAFQVEQVGEVNGNPVFLRVMRDFIAPYHTHKQCDEMFLIFDGELILDVDSSSYTLTSGDTFTIKAGQTHRSRVPKYAELMVIGGHG